MAPDWVLTTGAIPPAAFYNGDIVDDLSSFMTHLIVESGNGCHLLLLAHLIQLIQAPGLTHLQHNLKYQRQAQCNVLPPCLDVLRKSALRNAAIFLS